MTNSDLDNISEPNGNDIFLARMKREGCTWKIKCVMTDAEGMWYHYHSMFFGVDIRYLVRKRVNFFISSAYDSAHDFELYVYNELLEE